MVDEIEKKESRVPPQRILGTYPQRQEGQYMQRIPLLGGRINPSQWQAIANIARRYSSGTPLHLTTRQDIELHNIAETDIGAVYEQLHQVGFDTFGACGDCVRNITICPGCEFCEEAVDVQPLARLTREILFASPILSDLPRKFKISFSGCAKACARPFINDLGFVANGDGTFRVIGAGSLGSKPQPGIELYASLTAQEVVWLASAAMELFVRLGDRDNRRKARLRHVRQRLGDEEFRKQLHERFDTIKQKLVVLTLNGVQAKQPKPFQTTLQFVTGQISLDDAESLAMFCEQNHIETRINLDHGIELFGDKQIILPAELSMYENLPRIIACPGSDTCTHGLTNCRKLATQLTTSLAGAKWKDKMIAISGCPNNCAQSAVADIGLCGCVKTIDGRRQEAYQVSIGGGCGRNDRLAKAVGAIWAEQIPQDIVTVWENNTGKE
jgi:sulfite reductase beta subunit-like hemoprotein